MWPRLDATIGDTHVAVSLYGIAVLVAVATGIAVSARRAWRPDVVLVAAPLVAAAALAGAAALHRVVHGTPGLGSIGGIAGGLAAIALAGVLAGTGVTPLLDAFAPGALAALAIGRVGCFLAGCCFGLPTDLPWGIVLPELGPPARHPAQLYAAAVDCALALWVGRAGGPPGTAARRALVGLGTARLLQTVRDPAATDVLFRHGPSLAQCGAMLLVLAGLAVRPRASVAARTCAEIRPADDSRCATR